MAKGGTIPKGLRDFAASERVAGQYDGTRVYQSESQRPPVLRHRLGDRIPIKNSNLWRYFIPEGTLMTEENAYLFTHNMAVDAEVAKMIGASGQEKGK